MTSLLATNLQLWEVDRTRDNGLLAGRSHSLSAWSSSEGGVVAALTVEVFAFAVAVVDLSAFAFLPIVGFFLADALWFPFFFFSGTDFCERSCYLLSTALQIGLIIRNPMPSTLTSL